MIVILITTMRQTKYTQFQKECESYQQKDYLHNQWLSSNLDKVHDISPSLQRDDEEYGHPGQANVVKRDGSVKRISGAGGASGVILKSEVCKCIMSSEFIPCSNSHSRLYPSCNLQQTKNIPLHFSECGEDCCTYAFHYCCHLNK